MAVKWTEEQQRVIDTRGCNLLVSAAAGSGKTAVLVARILQMITDETHPVDIDRLLVVTFTNAAAAEMRERIREALEQKSQEEPDNIHLQRQLVLVHNARITTIHSFCLNVLRNHFQTIGIDPDFRIADEGEVLLLEQDAVKETLDAAYEQAKAEPDEEFVQFLEELAPGKNDTNIEELILQVYKHALGQPWPEQWLEECRCMYENSEEWNADANTSAVSWLSLVMEDTHRLLDDLYQQTLEALRIAETPDGPYPYVPALQSDLEKIELLKSSRDYASCAAAFRNMGSFARLSTKKDDRISPQKKQQVQNMRGEIKDGLAEIRTMYFFDRPEVLAEEFRASGTVIRVLTRLTEVFMKCLAEKKNEKNLVDFGDLEHLALRILVNKEDDSPTLAAQEYAELFEEIMIDEYQDSNLVQELILSSVAGRGCQAQNRFMVGDVKQSIYRFRLARPDLFMEKYRTYGKEETSCRIDLHKNFRSRAEVLDGVNEVFRQIMTEHPGEMVYDADAALYPGAVFEQKPMDASGENVIQETSGGYERKDCFLSTELYLLEADSSDKQKQEAHLIGQRIRDMVGRELVWDKEQKTYRPVQYRDIVILLRTVSGWADAFGEALTEMGIPCFTGSQKGYFSAAEIRIVLSYLNILDNPMQDIPLAAVMHSAVGGFTEEELAQIRIASEKTAFYDCCQEYRKTGENLFLKEKLEQFFCLYEKLRKKCSHTPVHLLIWELLEETGYGDYAASLPAGAQRRANLDMLIQKAIAYESTSYRGLYHFVRYIENLKKYEVDYGEANLDSESADTVRILSIHKSKGLEFPIVILGGMGKQFNESDSRNKIILHPELGIGCDYTDLKNRTRRPTLLKKLIRQKTSHENLGEEMRVLYVAMTRAKEKLIMTGSVTDIQKRMEKWVNAALYQKETLSYSTLTGASSYLDWVLPVLLRNPASLEVLEKLEQPPVPYIWKELMGTAEQRMSGAYTHRAPYEVSVFIAEDLDAADQTHSTKQSELLDRLLYLDTEECQDEDTCQYLSNVFQAVYPYEADNQIIGKMSVSELKKLSHVSEEEDVAEMYQPETVIPLLPQFREEKTEIVGAARGTVYHGFMENLDFSRADQLEMQLEELVTCGKMTREEGEVLHLEDIRRFLQCAAGTEMKQAAERGQLYRERPFVFGVSADTIRPEWNPQETVLVQGIIDVWYLDESDRIVILDYKTDRVRNGMELVEKYRAQLDYYGLALSRMTGKEVREKIIYSFFLGKEIRL